MRKPLIVDVCLLRDDCDFKKVKKVGRYSTRKALIPTCRFKENCSQKFAVSYWELQKIDYNIEKLRQLKFKTF